MVALLMRRWFLRSDIAYTICGGVFVVNLSSNEETMIVRVLAKWWWPEPQLIDKLFNSQG